MSDGSSPSARRLGSARLLETLATRFQISRIEGFVDSVRAQEVLGWAYDAARPQRRVHIVACANRVVVAETLADLPRRDLASLEKGDGRYGFRLRIPAGITEDLVIEAVAKPRNIVLKHGRVSMAAETPGPHEGKIQSSPKAGFIERFDGHELVGWAFDPRQPDTPTTVDIFKEEVFLGVVSCDQARPNLLNSGAPRGAQGFRFVLPVDVTPTAASIRVRVSGTRIELARSRNFPGVVPVEPPLDDAEQAKDSSAPAAVTQSARLQQTRSARAAESFGEGVVVLIIGGGSETLAASEPSCRVAGVKDVRLVQTSADFRRGANGSHNILLAPGDRISPELPALLRESSPSVDAWTWRTAGAGSETLGVPETRAQIGGLNGALALSGFALAAVAQNLPDGSGELSIADLGRVALARGFSWRAFDAVLTEGVQNRVQMEPTCPERVSLALWSGWTAGTVPIALEAMLAATAACQVELLAPAEAVSALLPFEGRSPITTLRLVDIGGDAPAEERWARLMQAATGQVVVLARGDLTFEEPGQLASLCGWAALPHIGCVTGIVRGTRDTQLAGLDVIQTPNGWSARSSGAAGGGAPRIVAAAPADLLCVSRAAVALVGGISISDGPAADVGLGLRLIEEGRSSIVAPSVSAASASELMNARSVSPRTQVMLSAQLRKISRALE